MSEELNQEAVVEDTTAPKEIVEAKFSRFSGAPWFPKKGEVEVFIGGAGGISSWLALAMVRAGFVCHVWDFDLFEEHNMAGQFCKRGDIGISKVGALAVNILDFAGSPIYAYNSAYDKDSMAHEFMLSGFDNMEARNLYFHNWIAANEGNPNAIYIDGRLTFEQLQIFCLRGNDAANIEDYRTNHLFSSSEAEDAVCTAKQTSHSAMMIASHMVGFFTNHYTNVKTGEASRVVPYTWEYLIPLDFLTQ